MKTGFAIAVALCAAALAGCGEKTVETPAQLEAVFAPSTLTASTNQPEQVQMMVKQVVTALEKKDEATAVMSLEALRNTPDLTVDQVLAVQNMIAQAQKNLAARAAAGDPQAIAAMEALKYKHR